jgi:4,5-DOPA dioxygenase extradiol
MSALGGDAHAAALRDFGGGHSNARGVVIVSAHWQSRGPVRVTAWEHAPLVYDFGGFPDELYRIQYPAPGDPALAAQVIDAIGDATPELRRGLDHGAWVPLRLAWPEAAMPVVAVSLPVARPEEVFALGRKLRPLRDEGILIAGSGGIVHNLRLVDLSEKGAPADPWAAEFDEWIAERVARHDAEALFRYRADAPHADRAVPTSEHFDPIWITLGAAYPEDRIQSIYEGFHYGNISMRSFAFQ